MQRKSKWRMALAACHSLKSRKILFLAFTSALLFEQGGRRLNASGPDDFLLINGGTFQMGGYPRGIFFQFNSERMQYPAHKVTVSSFYLSKYEVTRAEFAEFARSTGSDNEKFFNCGKFKPDDRQPALCISWYDAIEYCNWRSSKDGLTPAYRFTSEWKEKFSVRYREVEWDQSANGYRLPTEAEWEYAARSGGKRQAFAGLDDAKKEQDKHNWAANWARLSVTLREYAVFLPDDAHWSNNKGSPEPVGSKKPNEFGLYDMTGNANEWCWDLYAGYTARAQKNPTGPKGHYGSRVMRGGSYLDQPAALATTERIQSTTEPPERFIGGGFRLARGPFGQ